MKMNPSRRRASLVSLLCGLANSSLMISMLATYTNVPAANATSTDATIATAEAGRDQGTDQHGDDDEEDGGLTRQELAQAHPHDDRCRRDEREGDHRLDRSAHGDLRLQQQRRKREGLRPYVRHDREEGHQR